MLGDQMLSVVDTIVIGAIGPTALAGATGAFAIFIAVVFALFGFGTGIQIIGAQRVGAHDLPGLGRAVRAGMVIPLAMACLVAAAIAAFARPALHAMLGDVGSLTSSASYLTWRGLSLIPIVISTSLLTGFGAAGNRKVSVQALVLINAVHLPLVFVLALGWLTHIPFGVAGAGISSLLSEIACAVYLVAYAARHPAYQIFSSRRIDRTLVLSTAWLSLPEVVFLLAVLAPDIFIVTMLAPFGVMTVAAFRALNVVSDLTFTVPIPLQDAAQTVIGQRLGAQDPSGARYFFGRALRVAVLSGFAIGAVVAVLARPIAWLFTFNGAVAALAAGPVALHMVTLPIKSYAMVGLAPLRASGDTRFSMFAGLVTSVLVLPVTYAGVHFFHAGLYAVPIGWICAWVGRAALTSARLRGGAWALRPTLPA